jgi:hypothetical protein
MRSVRFLFPLLLLPMFAGVAACAQFVIAPNPLVGEGGSGGGAVVVSGGYGAAADTTASGTTSGSSSGGGGGTQGTVTPPIPLMDGSFSYLCGDSNSLCVVGGQECTQGGNPDLNGGSPDGSASACQIVPDGSEVKGQCGMSGYGTDGDACATVGGCQAGFGCMVSAQSASVGTCRAYCCQDLESCPTGTYCSPIAMFGATGQAIPVCIAASMCHLLEDAKDCPVGTTCSIVRENGTTSCVVPGTAVAGDACTGSAGPCAAGYVCSSATGTCLELCHTDGGTECGPGGTCQGGTVPFPDGIGFCVF